jgi:hypothetical protein
MAAGRHQPGQLAQAELSFQWAGNNKLHLLGLGYTLRRNLVRLGVGAQLENRHPNALPKLHLQWDGSCAQQRLEWSLRKAQAAAAQLCMHCRR